MTSREGREYLMPLCPIAMPSHTPMQGTMTGLPPAAMTPSAAARATWSRYICPGMMSLCAEMMPTMGFFISLSVQPRARRSERCDAILLPFVKVFAIKMPPKIHIVRVRAPRGTRTPLCFAQQKKFVNSMHCREQNHAFASQYFPRAKPRFCAAGLNLPDTSGLVILRTDTFAGDNVC